MQEDKHLYKILKKDSMKNPTRFQDRKNQAAVISNHNTINLLQNITIPTFIMVGLRDIINPRVNIKLLHEKIPNSTLEVFKGVGHQLIVEASEKVNNLTWNFIQHYLE